MKQFAMLAVYLIIASSTVAQDSTAVNQSSEAVCKRITTSRDSSKCGGGTGLLDICMKCEECSKGLPTGWKKLSDYNAVVQQDTKQASTMEFFCTSYIASHIYALILAALHLIIAC